MLLDSLSLELEFINQEIQTFRDLSKYPRNKVKYRINDSHLKPKSFPCFPVLDINNNYYSWEAPGIGRNIVYSFFVGIFLFGMLLINEYQLFSKLVYFIDQKFSPKHPVDVEHEDSDVAEEKRTIRESSEENLYRTYTLAIRDVTKYYKKFLAVNGICLGVKKYECFGLLGINGAGKTTTFKMMTGDVLMSYGDGWVNGYSIKHDIQKVKTLSDMLLVPKNHSAFYPHVVGIV